MANTPNLLLTNPTPGDPATTGVWGVTENTGRTLVDSAVAGILTLSIAGSGTTVLTSTIGAADQARNAHFVFTGALTGAATVLFPQTSSRIFSVTNSTTGAFSLLIGANNGSGAAGGTTATVPQGSTMLLISNGTNVAQRLNALDSLGIGMKAVNILDITQTQNTGSVAKILNANTSTGAHAKFVAGNLTHEFSVIQFGTGYTTSGTFRQDGAYLGTDGAGGMTYSIPSDAFRWYVNNIEIMRTVSGGFLIGATTGAGDINNSVIVAGGIFSTVNGVTGSVASGDTTTLFTINSGQPFGTYLVSAQFQVADPGTYSMVALVSVDNQRTAITMLKTSGFNTMSVDSFPTAMNVKATNGAGSAQAFTWNCLRIA